MALSLAVLTIVIAGCALGYCELQAWSGVARWLVYGLVGVMVGEFSAKPMLFQLLYLDADWIESLAMAAAFTVALLIGIYEGRKYVE